MSAEDIVCPCGSEECSCDCVSDYVDCVCSIATQPFTDDEVSTFREKQRADRAAALSKLPPHACVTSKSTDCRNASGQPCGFCFSAELRKHGWELRRP